MSNPFVGQLTLAAFNFAPVGWALAQGQLLPISQNTALFSLLGTYYGGDGRSTFALPNLQGAVAVGQGQLPGGSFYSLGESGGQETVTLLSSEVPAHTHTPKCADDPASLISPTNNAFAKPKASIGNMYSTATSPTATLNQGVTSVYGGNLAHNNLMPYLTLNWIISLQGVFPTRS